MSKPIHPVEKIFNRYGFVTFMVAASLTLAIIIYACFNTFVIATTPKEDRIDSSIPASFDKETADKINNLHDSTNPPNVDTPTNLRRSNPFVE
ncbi:hypothetical protein GX865_03090 [Candidatus Saccharibacteria bacterium]|jgi:magnesium-transporting ATPase (P-type)|nr:hypothetical protein [Candidatus Saccharibacteria bacterium]